MFGIIGIICLIHGINSYRNLTSLRRIGIEATAVITDIQFRETVEGPRRSVVFIEFNVDGRKYRGALDRSRSGMAVGQNVTVFYHPDNPQNFVTDPNPSGAILYILIGGVIVLGHIFYFLSPNSSNSEA